MVERTALAGKMKMMLGPLSVGQIISERLVTCVTCMDELHGATAAEIGNCDANTSENNGVKPYSL